MNILFTICGRAGSKGLKNKNLKSFLGVPLAYYTLAAIKLYEDANPTDNFTTVINTDSFALGKLVSKDQKIVDVEYIHRNESLSGDKIAKVAVIKDCLDKITLKTGIQYDVVVDLDITSPLRTISDIKMAIDKKIERKDVDVVYSVTESRRNPCFNMVKEEGKYFTKAIKSSFTTRQDAPKYYDMNASIYAYSIEALKTKKFSTFFNDHCFAIAMKDTGVLDIDCEEDFELMEVIAKYLFDKYPEYGEVANFASLFVH